jgi:hypothetical protein
LLSSSRLDYYLQHPVTITTMAVAIAAIAALLPPPPTVTFAVAVD